ncbi:MAG: preprotein translocase subunit SecE [Flavobacteriales bacterium]|jgi:preprotein translocase subunit SecE
MAGIVNYVQESYNELRNHVTWTPLAEAQRLMVVVAVFSVVFALAVWGVDTVFSRVIAWYFETIVKGL